MTVHVTKPQLSIEVLPFLSSQPNRQIRLTASERTAFRSKVVLPTNSFSSVQIRDDLDSSSFSITIPNGAHKNFLGQAGQLIRFRQLLSEGSIIRIFESNRLLFCGYATGASLMGNPTDGGADLQISGGSLYQAIRLQTVYIDTPGRPSDNAVRQNPDRVAGSIRGSLSTSIAALVGATREFQSPSAVIKALMDWSLQNLLDLGNYGGQKYSSLLSQSLSQQTYTSAFLHVLNFLQDARIGARINYWDLAAGFAQEPLYELFSEYQGSVFLSEQERSIELTTPTLIFRKTPWYLFNRPPLDDNSIVTQILPSHILGDSLSSSISNIMTGVHVSLSVLDQSTGLVINPVTYSPALLEQFGQRVLPIYLTGVKFENDNNKNNGLKRNLQDLQNMLFDTFIQTPRPVSGSIMTHYLPEVRKGMILYIQNMPTRGTLSVYDPVFYIQAVERTFQPQTGEINQTLHVKWGRYKGGVMG